MDQSNGDNGSGGSVVSNPNAIDNWNDLINKIDSLIENPEQRADRVREILAPYVAEFSNWDMICFCLAFLASQFMDYPMFLSSVKRMNKVIYQMHYQLTKEIGLIK